MLTRIHFRGPKVAQAGSIAGTAVVWLLAITQPARAMEDPVTGRWATRDPLFYNRSSMKPNTIIGPGKTRGNAFLNQKNFSQSKGSHSPSNRFFLISQQWHDYYEQNRMADRIVLYWFLGQDPISNNDPTGLAEPCSNDPDFLRWHGNWCGPHWSGGKHTCPCDPYPGNAPPIDNLDSCCQYHDGCYEEGGDNSDCNYGLCVCLFSMPAGEQGGIDWGGVAGWFGCETLIPPPPGP